MANGVWDGVGVWHELMSSNPDQAREFYGQVAGLTTAPLEGGPFPYTLWTQEGKPIGGLIPPEGDAGWPSGTTPHWTTSFAVEDVDRAADRTWELGGDVLVPPTDIPQFGRAAVLRDPQGAAFGVHQRT